ncbi:MAG TPA: hypothetical protein VJG90_01565 [Candidatus Nanoarchaeia archaeon]|nr:hypothetical protein [Candidatus Nanoarchaeia archaeon]
MTADKFGYDPDIDELTLPNGTDVEHNFTLHNATCHADCTNSEGRCNKDCEGYTYQNDTCHVKNCQTVLEHARNAQSISERFNSTLTMTACQDPDCFNDLSCTGNATLHGYFLLNSGNNFFISNINSFALFNEVPAFCS